MKRAFRYLAAFSLACLLLLPVRSEAAGASLSGNTGGIRGGSTVTLTFSVSGSNLTAINGSFSGISGMSLSNVSSARSGWTVTLNGNVFTAYDTAMTNPVNGSASVFVATFKVPSSAASGSSISAGISGVTASDTNQTISLGSASWSATVAAPLSGNANLTALSCSNAPLSPAFSGGTVNYSVTVPYEVSSLDLSYTRADSGASVSVSGNSLVVGSNTVTVTVTAENGAQKYYYITAVRQQDPNYKASTNAMLSALRISAGTISPAFSPTVYDYVAYVPYEVKDITLSGVAQDSKALSVKGVTSFLKPGDNVFAVRCTAEDQTTVGTYTVHVYRMPFYSGTLPVLSLGTDEPAPPDTPDTPAGEAALSALLLRAADLAVEGVTVPYVSDYTGDLPVWVFAAVALLLVVLLFYVIGTLVGKAVGRRRAAAPLQAEEPPEADLPEPEAAEPETTEPETTEPETAEPETAEPETVEPETVEPETVEPEAVEPETVEPETAEPETVEPETVEPETVEPETTEPEAKPEPAAEPEAVSEADKEAEELVHTMTLDDLLKDIRNL